MKPRLLDLFCGAGGATRGYQQAGFHVTGIDLNPQPNYVGDEFHQGDALDWPLDGYDAIHASPVCYAWSKMRDCRPGTKDDQPDLITPLRPLLEATGLPYVIENVPGAPLRNPVQICGSGLGMRLQRHRWFESNVPLWGVPCAHGQNPWDERYGHSTGRKRRRVPVIGEWRIRPELQHDAMGIDWMTLPELTEAIPPAFTEHIGRQIVDHLERVAS